MNILIDSYHQYRGESGDYFTGGNMFVYFSSAQVRHQDYRGPDFFVVLKVDGNKSRQGWVVWEEGGRYPDVIVELLSPSTEAADRGEKKMLYEQVFKTRNYFIYDPFAPEKFMGWELGVDQTYQELIPNEQGWLWSSVLGLWLGSWQGLVLKEPARWLRFYDPSGNLVPLPVEQAAAEHLRAQMEHQRAEMAEQEAETERQRAEMATQEAETERQRAESAEQRAAFLAARLRALGIDPNQL
jgi:Uma2 family endonuclease